MAGSNAESDGSVTSPERRKPKKHSVTAAQSITWSWDGPWASHTAPMALTMCGVIGSRVCFDD